MSVEKNNADERGLIGRRGFLRGAGAFGAATIAKVLGITEAKAQAPSLDDFLVVDASDSETRSREFRDLTRQIFQEVATSKKAGPQEPKNPKRHVHIFRSWSDTHEATRYSVSVHVNGLSFEAAFSAIKDKRTNMEKISDPKIDLTIGHVSSGSFLKIELWPEPDTFGDIVQVTTLPEQRKVILNGQDVTINYREGDAVSREQQEIANKIYRSVVKLLSSTQ
jgi:hypothetical protein